MRDELDRPRRYAFYKRKFNCRLEVGAVHMPHQLLDGEDSRRAVHDGHLFRTSEEASTVSMPCCSETRVLAKTRPKVCGK